MNKQFFSYSQDLEDLVVLKYFQQHPPKYKFLVDVGACQKMGSNTWGFLEMGWRGVVIDADYTKTERLKEDAKGLDVEIVISGVSDRICEMPLFENQNSGSSSFIPDWDCAGRTGRKMMVWMRKLAHILDEKNVPKDFDYLSIDTEGMDHLILVALFEGSEYRPQIIVSELGTTPFEERNAFFAKFGYSFLRQTSVSGGIYSNLIYHRIA
jgi:FkbM family methyltransferase